MRRFAVLALALQMFPVLCAAAGMTGEEEVFRLAGTISLAGVGGRLDHLAADLKNGHLFLAGLGNNSLEVIDLRAGKRIRSIAGLRGPQGVAFASDLNRLFVALGGEGAVEIFDGGSLEPVAKISGLDDADNLYYDARTRLLYVGYGTGALGVIDAAKGKVRSHIKLSGHPESFQMEKGGRHIFVNLPSVRQVVVVGKARHAVVAAWTLPGSARSNFPMALDEANRRLFVGTREPARVLVLDTESGRLVSSLRIPRDVDDLFYDAKRGLIYAVCGEGFIEVISQITADRYRSAARISTARGARTGLFVPESGRFYLAVPEWGRQKAEIRVYEANGMTHGEVGRQQ